ncbi:hypothetical protein BGY98DRAFT_1100800 [Russula aff. rugulosa BPL654]|nr:hypothetical protein BGY98DRAFT_1100800 [Russula aff. rugulosa BPL654]
MSGSHLPSPPTRIKVFFAQKIDLTNVTSAVSHPQLTHAITQLNIIKGYSVHLAESLPSSWFSIDNSEGMQCIANKLRWGLTTCEWLVPLALLPSIASAFGGDKGTWLVANIMCLEPASLHIEIEGIQTWACIILVEKYGIRCYRAHTHKEGGMTGINAGIPMTWTTFEVPTEKKIHVLRLWACGWGSKFDIIPASLYHKF